MNPNPVTIMDRPKNLFLFKRSDLFVACQEWVQASLNKNPMGSEKFEFVLGQIDGDQIINMLTIISILAMFPEKLSKYFVSTRLVRIRTLDSDSNLQILLHRGQLYRLRTLILSKTGSAPVTITPHRNTIILDFIRVYDSLPDRLMEYLLYPVKNTSDKLDIETYGTLLFECLYLGHHYDRVIASDRNFLHTAIEFKVTNRVLIELMLTRNVINACHVKQYVPSELKSVLMEINRTTYSRRFDIQITYEPMLNTLTPGHTQCEFRGNWAIVCPISTTDLNFIEEARFYTLVARISKQESLPVGDHLYANVPKTVKLMQERYIPTSFQATIPHTLPSSLSSFLRPLKLTPEQEETFQFMSTVECTNYRDSIAIEVVCEEPKNVIICSPYIGNSTLHHTRQTWDACSKFTGGILANAMGSGKTLSVLSLCSKGTSLIVVPNHLVTHWKTEVQKHTTLGFEPTSLGQYALVLARAKDIPRACDTFTEPSLCIISHSAFRCQHWDRLFSTRIFDRLVIEEAHLIEESSTIFSKLITGNRARCTWAVTATPYSNCKNLLSLIRYTDFLRILSGSTANLFQKAVPVFQHFSLSTRFSLPNTTINTRVVYSPTTQQEDAFFVQLRARFKGLYKTDQISALRLRRVFRIMERISAGGAMNTSLMLRLVEQYLTAKRMRVDMLLCAPKPATRTSFMKSSDDCTICLDRFSDPVQLSCGHVFCTTCLLAMMALGTHQCAMCRLRWILPLATFTPSWLINTTPNNSDLLSLQEYYCLLEGTDNAVDSKRQGIELNGKVVAFTNELNNFVETRHPKDRLVIYVKRQQPAAIYLRILQATSLSFLTAGCNSMSKENSVTNIERFRMGCTDVLFTTIQFSTGFDLPIASHLWIMDYDVDIAKMEQCKGRCIRLGQVNSTVEQVVFLYKNSFDDFLYNYQHIGKMAYTLGHTILLEYFFYSYDEKTVFGRIRSLGHRIFGVNNQLKMTAQNRILTINNLISINLRTEMINNKYNLRALLEKSPACALFLQWRRKLCDHISGIENIQEL